MIDKAKPIESETKALLSDFLDANRFKMIKPLYENKTASMFLIGHNENNSTIAVSILIDRQYQPAVAQIKDIFYGERNYVDGDNIHMQKVVYDGKIRRQILENGKIYSECKYNDSCECVAEDQADE